MQNVVRNMAFIVITWFEVSELALVHVRLLITAVNSGDEFTYIRNCF